MFIKSKLNPASGFQMFGPNPARPTLLERALNESRSGRVLGSDKCETGKSRKLGSNYGLSQEIGLIPLTVDRVWFRSFLQSRDTHSRFQRRIRRLRRKRLKSLFNSRRKNLKRPPTPVDERNVLVQVRDGDENYREERSNSNANTDGDVSGGGMAFVALNLCNVGVSDRRW